MTYIGLVHVLYPLWEHGVCGSGRHLLVLRGGDVSGIPIPAQQFGELMGFGPARDDALKRIGEPSLRIGIVEQRCVDQ
jgi:hypothetical protein